MTITDTNLTAHELIGLRVSISTSTDPTKRGLIGTVRNETRNTITIETQNRLLSIAKAGSSFTFQVPTGNMVTIEGSRILLRPEDRIKRGLTHW
jgi:ribonuclease P protein subunit POP4